MTSCRYFFDEDDARRTAPDQREPYDELGDDDDELAALLSTAVSGPPPHPYDRMPSTVRCDGSPAVA